MQLDQPVLTPSPTRAPAFTQDRAEQLKLLRRFLNTVEPGDIDREKLRGYVLTFVERDISVGYHSQLVAALRFFCEHVLRDRSLARAIPSPKRPSELTRLRVGDLGADRGLIRIRQRAAQSGLRL